jgi:restriction system protein
MKKKRKRRNPFNELISKVIAFAIILSVFSSYIKKVDVMAHIKIYTMIFAAVLISTSICRVLIERVCKYRRRKKYLSSSLSQIDRMDGKEFEKYLKAVFEEKGYKVKLTKDSGDFGADLIMYKAGGFEDDKYKLPEKVIVQAKRYKGNVGIEAVQQIAAAKEYYKADKCAVATNRYFTKAAKALARANNIDLWDREFFFGIPKTV